MKRKYKIIFILLGVLAFFTVSFYILIHLAFDGIFTGPAYSKQDLIDNFEKKKTEILAVRDFVDAKITDDSFASIEFDNEELGIFHVKKNGNQENNWDLNIDSPKTDSLLSIIGWTRNDLFDLKVKLKEANCISISSGKPIRVGWQRSGMGMFLYNVFDENLNHNLITKYNDGCTYSYYKDNIVLEYGGGAIGMQCFPEYYHDNLDK